MRTTSIGLLTAWFMMVSSGQAADMGTAFTYQGSIEKPAGSPYTGTCDFKFGLWDDASVGALATVTAPAVNPTTSAAVSVSGGVFLATIDFGDNAINGEARWLAIEVRCPAGAGAYSLLTPRVALTSAPNALRALDGVGPMNSLEVNASGQVGIGEPNPAHSLHIKGKGSSSFCSQDNPGVILENDLFGERLILEDCGGKWYMIADGQLEIDAGWLGGNGGTNFARDVFFEGDVGIGIGDGTTAPTAKLHVNAGASKGVRIDNTGSGLTAPAMHVVNTNASGVAAWMANGGTDATLVLQNDKTGGDAIIRAFGPLGTFVAFEVETVSGVGRVGINRDNPAYPLHVGTSTSNGNGAHVTTGGAWTNGSSRDFKENFEPIDKQVILQKLVELPVTQWQYKNEDKSQNLHIGPVAEDFRAAFGLGHDERYITTVDADGVALAAIQGLEQILQERDCEIRDLQSRKDDLEARVAALELMMSKILATQNGGGQ